MIDKHNIDDRSMGEILASIRKIVTHEETSRRNGGDGMRASQVNDEADPLILTYDMRVKKTADAPNEANTRGAAEKAGHEAASSKASDSSAKTSVDQSDETPPKDAGASAVPSRPEGGQASAPMPDPEGAQTSSSPSPLLAGVTLEEVEELVRRIVREELQGPIGMQINRKVKRMVREEVTSAMDNDAIL